MSSTESTLAPTNPRRRILWLVLAHLVVGLMGAWVAYFAGRGPTLRGAAFIGIVFSQTSLLGIWGGLGSGLWWRRLIVVVVVVGYLGTLLGVGISELNRYTFLLVVLTTTFVAIPLLVVRFFRLTLQLDSTSIGSVGRIQFSIRHLMILTFVVACLITIGKWVQPHFSHDEFIYLIFFFYPLFAVTFGVVGVLPVWFILAAKRRMLYSLSSVAVGACGGYCLGRIDLVGNGELWMTAAATEAMAVVVSLLVVRSCGYRLLRLPPGHQRGR